MTGLVLEGGGLRAQYSAGVLDCFLKENIEFPYVIGVSAGISIASSYVSKQFERNKKIINTYIKDSRYLSFKNLIFTGSFFGMDFIYNKIPNELIKFDFDTFNNSKTKFVTVTTDCLTGKPVYFNKESSDLLTVLKASSSMPFVSKITKYNGYELLDGAITDSIPIKKSIYDGNTKNIIILTRNAGYRKKKNNSSFLENIYYKKYPELIKAIVNRYKHYNDTSDYIDQLEKEENAIVIRPSQNLKINRMTKDLNKLNELYELGFEDAKNYINKIKTVL
jgi:predicted patatin/cPLA2 family phospholipase